mmetsp:Transcript_57423/g.186221  ORF Transcript_57423/g.186221 Transcript_57423/m.186221 type:complete len:230 (+) Transcript_57423:257-946(+)
MRPRTEAATGPHLGIAIGASNAHPPLAGSNRSAEARRSPTSAEPWPPTTNTNLPLAAPAAAVRGCNMGGKAIQAGGSGPPSMLKNAAPPASGRHSAEERTLSSPSSPGNSSPPSSADASWSPPRTKIVSPICAQAFFASWAELPNACWRSPGLRSCSMSSRSDHHHRPRDNLQPQGPQNLRVLSSWGATKTMPPRPHPNAPQKTTRGRHCPHHRRRTSFHLLLQWPKRL